MHWKLKATIQNAVSRLPEAASHEAYYWLQRRFGALRRVDPSSRLIAGIKTWRHIQDQDRSPVGKVFFEVGTGRAPVAPLAYWLMGAERTVSVDLNPYVKEELVADSLRYIADHEEKIVQLFGPLIDHDRLNALLGLARKSPVSTADFLQLCRIDYIAPGDAAATHLPENSIDFHTSFTVFEHIPKEILSRILLEGNRLIRDNGLFVHRIDYSDHFSHWDPAISAINFLQYSDEEWDRYAGNRYMYMNRLRHDDYLALFDSVGHRIVATQTYTNRRALETLRSGSLRLDERFSSRPEEILAITGSWMITQPRA